MKLNANTNSRAGQTHRNCAIERAHKYECKKLKCITKDLSKSTDWPLVNGDAVHGL